MEFKKYLIVKNYKVRNAILIYSLAFLAGGALLIDWIFDINGISTNNNFGFSFTLLVYLFISYKMFQWIRNVTRNPNTAVLFQQNELRRKQETDRANENLKKIVNNLKNN